MVKNSPSEVSHGVSLARGGEVSPRLLEILVCPLTKTRLVYHPTEQELWSEVAGLAYPIRDGIPILLVEEARRMSHDVG
ncbi:MAG: Trm112 family protein [Candidatus Pacebacteria bacterium]|nr:Trm112 family protein [Candidatus Paceibacterota bacterium]